MEAFWEALPKMGWQFDQPAVFANVDSFLVSPAEPKYVGICISLIHRAV
jgi:hypothetical protein